MKRWFEQRKALMIAMGVVWILLALFFVPAYIRNSLEYVEETNAKHTEEGIELLDADNRGVLRVAIDTCQKNITEVGKNLEIGGPTGNTSTYFYALKNFSIGYLVVCGILLVMVKTDREYEGKEHGSADWAENGEEYSVLSKKDGFILAKDHYMPMIPNPPTGKNGNILVIGGSRKW